MVVVVVVVCRFFFFYCSPRILTRAVCTVPTEHYVHAPTRGCGTVYVGRAGGYRRAASTPYLLHSRS